MGQYTLVLDFTYICFEQWLLSKTEPFLGDSAAATRRGGKGDKTFKALKSV